MARELIFAVEDDINIQELIKYNLEAARYRVLTFDRGDKLLEHCKIALPALFILDIMLPDIDGLEICKRLRQNEQTKNIPVIMLTAKSEEFDKVLGLELGADDYVTKPFSVRELTARVKAVLRRVNAFQAVQTEIIKFGDISIDIKRHEVYKKEKLLEMPLKEFNLLKTLAMNKGKVLSRELLLEEIWGYDYAGETRTVDVHIRYLRQKVEKDSNNPVYIETVRGVGYRFNDKGAASK